MTIYVDTIKRYDSGEWCHMAVDGTLDELHEFAQRIGLKREWFQDHPVVKHYDLRASKRKLAIEHGAIEVSNCHLVAICSGKYPVMRYLALREIEKKNND